MISVGLLSFVLVWWFQIVIFYTEICFLPDISSKCAFYGKMGDEKSHHNVLGRGFLPLRDGNDRNFTVISGLAAHIFQFST